MSKLKVTADGVSGDGYFVKFKKWVGKLAKAETVPADDYVGETEPSNCPICNGRIEQKDDSDSYVCIGLANREEVEASHPHGKKLPSDVTHVAPCGWHGLADEYGKTWV